MVGGWDDRGLALCRAVGSAWGQLAHAWGLCLASHSADTDTDSDPTRPPLLGGGLCLSGFLGPI